MHKYKQMKGNGVLYLDEFLSRNKENTITTDSIEQNSFKEIYEIEEYILRKQAENMVITPDLFYKEEYFPNIHDLRPKPVDKKSSIRKLRRNEKYKPKHVRGQGVLREGLCEECDRWFRLKTSSYWYHMNFKHGISSTGIKYPEPEIYYNDNRAYSICNQCNKEVLLGTNNKSMKYNWYKHFQKEHQKMYD